MTITNKHNIPLGLAVWLLADDYDYQQMDNYLSVTSLMKPVRQIILSSRPTVGSSTTDLSDYVARAMGTALHDSIEKAWLNKPQQSLIALGYPDSVVKRVLINPLEEELIRTPDAIPIYLEQRAFQQVGKWTIGGKFDMVIEGTVHDNKSTSAYAWTMNDKDKDYQLQGSLYRWLNPDKITEDFIRINFIFTDWNKAQAASNPDYPQARVQAKEIPLLSVVETHHWVEQKLLQLEKYWNAPDAQIPECTDEELWRTPTIYKYYANPAKTSGRSTKNFKSLHEANMWKSGRGGVVIPVIGEPKRCGYCEAVSHCQQAKRYFND